MFLHGVLSVVDGVALLLVALLPLATWQRTKRAGFAWLAAAFAVSGGLTLAWLVVPRLAGPDGIQMLMLPMRLAGLVPTGLAGIGLWKLYVAAKAPAA